MGIVLRQSLFSSISAYIGVGIGYINAVILMPLFMSPGEIGLMRAVMSISLLLVIICMFGMGGVIVRYFPKLGNNSKALNQLFTIGLVTILLSFTFITSFLLLGKNLFFSFFNDNAPELNQFLGLIIIMFLQMTVFRLFESIANSQKQIMLPNFIRELGYKILHTLIILIYGFNYMTFQKYMYAHAVTYLILIIVLSIPTIKSYNLRLDFSILNDKPTVKEVFNFAIISILSGLGSTIIIQIDQIMVTKYLGLAENGIYTIAIFMAAVIELPKKYISQISSPIIAESMANKDFNSINEHYRKASINQLILGLFIFLLILINLDFIYELMPNGKTYNHGWWVFFIIGLVKIVDMGFSLNGEIIGFSKYFRFNLYAITLLSILAVINNIIFIPTMGILGAAIATLISYLLFNLAKYLYIKTKFGFEVFSGKTILIIVISFICVLICFNLPNTHYVLVNILVRSLTFVLLFVCATFYFNVSDLFNDIIRKIIHKPFKSTKK